MHFWSRSETSTPKRWPRGSRNSSGRSHAGPNRPPSAPANLAEVHEHVVEALVAQQIRDPVGDIALGDAVQRDAHARMGEPDPPGGDGHVAVVDEPPHPLDGSTIGASACRDRAREVGGVEGPERLHGGVEGAARHLAEGAGEGEQVHEIRGRVLDDAVAVQLGDRRSPAIEAEDVFESAHLRHATPEDAARVGGITVGDLDGCARTEGDAPP